MYYIKLKDFVFLQVVQRHHLKCYTRPGWLRKHKQRWIAKLLLALAGPIATLSSQLFLVINITTAGLKLLSCLSYKICRRNNLPLLNGGQCSQKVSLMILCALEDL